LPRSGRRRPVRFSETVPRRATQAKSTPRRGPSKLGQVDAIPGYAILPLRLFLGFTFLYAGWQKINDPGFFTLGSHTYIGTQLVQFSHHSPIGGLLQRLAEQAVLIGWLTTLTEMAIGVAVLLGLFTRLAAIGGLTLNLVFFLSASWNVYPYFLGSDIVFVAAWLTLAITGAGAYALDPLVADSVAELATRPLQRLLMGQWQSMQPSETSAGDTAQPVAIAPSQTSRRIRVSRREALFGGFVTLVLLWLGLGPRAVLSGSTVSGVPATSPTPGPSPTPAPAASGVVNLSQLPANSAFPTTDPASGDPAIIVHTPDNHVYAYDAICPHAGCTVDYDTGYKLLVCPCHGGAFDPAQGAAVVAGPPPGPLTSLPIHVDSGGNVHWG
jgi:thiosulfate dehydrogenase (quinone) large subunit